MYADILKFLMLLNSIFIFIIGLYLIFSKKNEPTEYPEKFSKIYKLKPKKKITI